MRRVKTAPCCLQGLPESTPPTMEPKQHAHNAQRPAREAVSVSTQTLVSAGTPGTSRVACASRVTHCPLCRAYLEGPSLSPCDELAKAWVAGARTPQSFANQHDEERQFGIQADGSRLDEAIGLAHRKKNISESQHGTPGQLVFRQMRARAQVAMDAATKRLMGLEMQEMLQHQQVLRHLALGRAGRAPGQAISAHLEAAADAQGNTALNE